MRTLSLALLAFCFATSSIAGPPNAKARQELATSSKQFKSLRTQGRKLVKTGKFEEGMAKYREALALNPRNASVLGELGFAALKAKKIDLAEEMTRRALTYARSNKRRGALLYNLALIFEIQGDVGSAITALEDSLVARANRTVEKKLAELTKRGMKKKALNPIRTFKTLDEVKAALVSDFLAYAHAKAADCPALEVKARGMSNTGAGLSQAMVLTLEGVCGDIAPGGRSVAHVAMEIGTGWKLMPPLFETENSGCCGAYRDYKIGKLKLREVANTPGLEVVAPISFEDQDSDMGIDAVFHSSWDATLVCGVHQGTPYCQYFKTREASYDGSLEKFLDGAINAKCWTVTLKGGVATRRPAPCDGEAKAKTRKTLRYDIRTGKKR